MQYVDGALHAQIKAVADLLDLKTGGIARPVVGHCRGSDEHLCCGHFGLNRVIHLLRRFHVDAAHARRCAQIHRAADQRHLGAQFTGCLCHRIAHFPGAAIADKPHRIDALARRTGGDQHPMTCQRPLHRQQGHGRIGQGHRLQHAPLTGLAAGLTADAGAQHLHATRAQ